jgi:hypothetical protein
MIDLTTALTRLDKRRRHFRIGSLSFIAIQTSVVALCLAALTLSLSRAEEHYARMAKVNQEQIAWTR